MSIKNKLKLGEDVYGVWCVIPSPEVIGVISKSGLDFVIVDMEHGTMDYTIAQQMVVSAQSEKCDAIIRTPRNDESNILKSLDKKMFCTIFKNMNSLAEFTELKYDITRGAAARRDCYAPPGLRSSASTLPQIFNIRKIKNI